MGQHTVIFNAGYDQTTLYRDLQDQVITPIILLNRHGGEPSEGRDSLGRPVCSMGFTLTLDGFDPCTQSQKFRCPHCH